ncbi:MAG: response regulator [Planctomycetota bacterium]
MMLPVGSRSGTEWACCGPSFDAKRDAMPLNTEHSSDCGALGPLRLLLIEDDPLDRAAVRRALRGRPYEIREVECGEDALEAARTWSPQVVILDQRLPDASGVELLEPLRRICPYVPVVMVTGLDRVEFAVESMRAGAQDYLLKDQLNAENLDRTLRAARERSRLEVELEIQRTELEQARDLAVTQSRTKDEFLATVSHELRTPVAAILGFAELLLDESAQLSLPDNHVRAIETIRRNGEHLIGLINDILDLSKIEAGKLAIEEVPTDIAEIVDDVIGLLEPKANEKGLSVRVEDLSRIPPSVRTDPTRFRQILLNLVGNAIKFTEHGTVLILVNYPSGSERLETSVLDSGIGMTSEELEKIFRPYEQATDATTRKYGGTGLGLTITKNLVELLGGELSAKSQPGRGTTFRFVLPAPNTSEGLQTDATLTEHQEQQLDLSQLEGARVLVAEDSEDLQLLIRRFLERVGIETEIVETGRDAVNRVLEESEAGTPYDAVLMDWSMPILSGLDATRELREAGEELPIIALTAHAAEGAERTCLEAGCSAYMPKPVDRTQLIDRLRSLVRRDISTS